MLTADGTYQAQSEDDKGEYLAIKAQPLSNIGREVELR